MEKKETKNNKTLAKPFLKWAGGKGQLIEKFQSFYPEDLKKGKIKNYYEPFIGGGAVFFDVAQQYNIQSAFLYDINDELIITYRSIQQDIHKLIQYLYDFQKKYANLDEKEQSEFYYETRAEFNENRTKTDFSKYSEKWVLRAAQIIFMNKTCFNGLFRFNSKGGFNVPVGRYKNPKILDEQNLLRTSEILKIAVIRKADFREVEIDLKKDSFVYYDPPYRPISKSSGFTAYSKHKFEDAEQLSLSELFHRLHKKDIKQMLSNSDPKNFNPDDNFFDEMYNGFNISRVTATRMINSNAAKRNAINEIIVTNYPCK